MRVAGGEGFPSRGFWLYWQAGAVSGFGSYITLLALQTLVVLTLHGSAAQVGWLNAARWLPYLVVGVVVGALVDRRRRRPVMVATDLAQAVMLVAIPVRTWTLASSGRLAISSTASATCRTSMRGSTAVVPFACGTPADMRSVISVAALPMSICPQAMLWRRQSSEMLLVRPVMACLVAV